MVKIPYTSTEQELKETAEELDDEIRKAMDDLILGILKHHNGFWWRPDDQNSMSEAHRIELKFESPNTFEITTVCNCHSHSTTEGQKKIFTANDYYDAITLLIPFVKEHWNDIIKMI